MFVKKKKLCFLSINSFSFRSFLLQKQINLSANGNEESHKNF